MILPSRDQLVLRIAAAPVLIALIYLGLYGRQRFVEMRELQNSAAKISRPLEDIQRNNKQLEKSVASLEHEVQQLQAPLDTGLSGQKLVARQSVLPAGIESERPVYAAACTHLIQLFLEEQLRCESSEFVSTDDINGGSEVDRTAFRIRFVGHYGNMLAALRTLDDSDVAFVLQNFTMRRDIHADFCEWSLTVLLERGSPQ